MPAAHIWPKTFSCFCPSLQHLYQSGELLSKAGIAFVAMGLCASVVYLMNDLLDLESDRAHAQRKSSVRIGKPTSSCWDYPNALAVFNLIRSGIFSSQPYVHPYARWVLLATCAYSFNLKKRILVDVFMLAGLYSLRIWMGSTIPCDSESPIGACN